MVNARAHAVLFAGILAGLVSKTHLAAADSPARNPGARPASPFLFGDDATVAPNPVIASNASLDPSFPHMGQGDNAQAKILRARLDAMKPSDPGYQQTLRDLEAALGIAVKTPSVTFSSGSTTFTSGSTTQYVRTGGYSPALIASPNLPKYDTGLEAKKTIAAIPLFTPVTLVEGTAISLTVGGAMDPWLAGLPAGAHTKNGNAAPQYSPVYVGRVTPGQVLIFSAQSKAGNVEMNVKGSAGHASENGLAALEAPFHSLAGVFLDDNPPGTNSVPESFSFQSTDKVVRPGLWQVFYIGDGHTDTGMARQFLVPEGATRLFLGATNSNSLSEQFGQFAVQIKTAHLPSKFFVWLMVGFFALIIIPFLYMALRHKPSEDEPDFGLEENGPAESEPSG